MRARSMAQVEQPAPLLSGSAYLTPWWAAFIGEAYIVN